MAEYPIQMSYVLCEYSSLDCTVSHLLFLLSSTTGISEAVSNDELALSHTRIRNSLMLSAFFVTKYLCWSSSGIACWIGTLLSSDDVLLKPRSPCLIQACAHIRLERSGEGDPFPSHCSHAGHVTPLETAAMLQHNRWHMGPVSSLLGVGKERGLCWHCKLFLKQKESQLAPPLSCRKEQERAVIWHMYSGAWVCEFMSTFTAC